MRNPVDGGCRNPVVHPSPPIPDSPVPGPSDYLGYSVSGAHSFPSGKQNKGMAPSSRSSSSCCPRSKFSRYKEWEKRQVDVEVGAGREGLGAGGLLCAHQCIETAFWVWLEEPQR